MIKGEAWAYEQVARRLGHKLRTELWDYLVHHQYVASDMDEHDLCVLINHYRELEKLGAEGRKASIKREHEEPPDERLRYLSEILAYKAEQRPGVIKFRQDVLRGQLLSPDMVEEWIKDVAKREGSHIPSRQRRYITVDVPLGTEIKATDRGFLPDPPITVNEEMISSYSGEILDYSIPTRKGTYRIPVVRDGILDNLLQVSNILNSLYAWQKAQATVFILTGAIPLIPLTQTTMSVHSNRALNTITIKTNSRLSPKQVAAIYGRARKELMGYRGQRKSRPLTKKHLELAVFLYRHQGMKGTDMMKKWNREHPEYPYSQVTNFSRDAKYAHDRLLEIK